MIRGWLSNDRGSIVAPRHKRLLAWESRRFNPGLERPGYHEMPLRGKSQWLYPDTFLAIISTT